MGAASAGMSKDQGHFCMCMLKENYKQDENNKWIICSGCNKWCHHKCNLLWDTEYDEILDSNKDWFCLECQCQEKETSNSLKQQQKEGYTPIISSPEQIKMKIRSRMSRKCKEKKLNALSISESPSTYVDSQPKADSQNTDLVPFVYYAKTTNCIRRKVA